MATAQDFYPFAQDFILPLVVAVACTLFTSLLYRFSWLRHSGHLSGKHTAVQISNAFDEIAPPSKSEPKKVPSEVFINHRGTDTKQNLASTIYDTLHGMGVQVFLDKEVLELGDVIPAKIQEAMRTSFLHIVILSPRYAESPWCLAELSFMLKTGSTIIPVFYNVDPSDVRYLKRSFADAFAEHESKKRYSPEKLKDWKEALHNVSFLSGQILKDNVDEGRLLKSIVNHVLKKSNKISLMSAKHPTGLDVVIEDFEKNALEGSKNVQIVGIVGMGGSGKTTLAKEFYNKKISSIYKCSFLFDIREAAANDNLHCKQKQLMKDLGFTDFNGLSFDNVEKGKAILKCKLSSLQVLIVLDDIDHQDQLDALLPVTDFGCGSLIIVTSRETGILQSWGISSIYSMKKINPGHAKELLCWHAFLKSSPPNEFQDLVEKFVQFCDGLPLSLKVFGGLLHAKPSEYWKTQLRKASRILPSDIKERLKISFDALDKEEQNIFLDIACFFIGEEKSLGITVWDGSGWDGMHGWQVLENKGLVEVDKHNHIKMHDQQRDLGREIAKGRSPFRVWSTQQITEILKQTTERVLIRGIKAPSDDFYKESSTHEATPYEVLMEHVKDCSTKFKALTPSIHVVKGSNFTEELAIQFPALLWLRWINFPDIALPSWLRLQNLRVLELQCASYLEELWNNTVDAPVQLRVLFISQCHKFQIFPSSIKHLSHLKKIIIKGGCKLGSLPEEFCSLKSLEHLQLQSCEMLSLPNSFGDLRNLRYLDLSVCCKLKMLPFSFGKLTLLQYLDLGECEQLILMSEDFEKITKLEHLNLSMCKQLEKLPRHITNQVFLRELYLNGLKRLRELPNDIGILSRLQMMRIGSDLLTSLPNSLGDLCSLTDFSIEDCPNLEYLPNTIGKLSSLTVLSIQKCPILKFLPNFLGELHSLNDLFIQDCPNLKCLPNSLGDLSSLTNLSIQKCSIMENLPNSLGSLSRLIDLSILDCSNLNFLPNSLGDLSSLTCLSIGKCSSLLHLPNSLGDLSSLTELSIQDCPNFKSLPNSLEDLSSLRCIYIYKCPSLEYLPNSLGDLLSLTNLLLQDCPVLKYLPNSLGKLSSLTWLSVQSCSSLEYLPNSLGSLLSLTNLSIEDCPRLKSLPNSLGDLSSLTRLSIQKCPSLEYLPNSLGSLFSLTDLSIQDCSNLKYLPNSLGDLSSLTCLLIQKCSTLENLPNSLGDLSSLIELSIQNCSNIKCLPHSLRDLSSLTYLSIQKCPNLKNLPSCLENLSSLTDLSIQDCPNLESLPTSLGDLSSLTNLKIMQCPKLKIPFSVGRFNLL